MKKPEIIYLDDDIVVANKAAGILSIPDRYQADKPNMSQWLKNQLGEVFTIHRLDKDTSGIIVFARNPEAHQHISMQFEKWEANKKYLAIVDGPMEQESGEINLSIAHDPNKPGRMVINKKGKESLSTYTCREDFRHFSLLEVAIHTGRTHQIRVHLAAIGHPLAVDPYYGRRTEFFLSEIKKRKFNLGKFEEEKPLLSRTPLHSWQLSFTHPQSGTVCEFSCEPPKDMEAMLRQLSKWDKMADSI